MLSISCLATHCRQVRVSMAIWNNFHGNVTSSSSCMKIPKLYLVIFHKIPAASGYGKTLLVVQEDMKNTTCNWQPFLARVFSSPSQGKNWWWLRGSLTRSTSLLTETPISVQTDESHVAASPLPLNACSQVRDDLEKDLEDSGHLGSRGCLEMEPLLLFS